MVTVVVVVPPEVAENLGVPTVDANVSKIPDPLAFTGLPKLSWSWTVIGPSEEEPERAPDTGNVTMTSLFAGPAEMVSAWVALVSPEETALISGEPALVSP